MTPSATELRRDEAAGKIAIRPFRTTASEAELTDLRRRINATRFPERESTALCFSYAPNYPIFKGPATL